MRCALRLASHSARSRCLLCTAFNGWNNRRYSTKETSASNVAAVRDVLNAAFKDSTNSTHAEASSDDADVRDAREAKKFSQYMLNHTRGTLSATAAACVVLGTRPHGASLENLFHYGWSFAMMGAAAAAVPCSRRGRVPIDMDTFKLLRRRPARVHDTDANLGDPGTHGEDEEDNDDDGADQDVEQDDDDDDDDDDEDHADSDETRDSRLSEQSHRADGGPHEPQDEPDDQGDQRGDPSRRSREHDAHIRGSVRRARRARQRGAPYDSDASDDQLSSDDSNDVHGGAEPEGEFGPGFFFAKRLGNATGKDPGRWAAKHFFARTPRTTVAKVTPTLVTEGKHPGFLHENPLQWC